MEQKEMQLVILPRGWQKEIAKRMGCHRNTVSNAVWERNYLYPRVVKCVKEFYNIDLT